MSAGAGTFGTQDIETQEENVIMSTQVQVIRLETCGPAGSGLADMPCRPEDFQSPVPSQHVHVFFSDEAAGISVGVWDTTTMQEAFGPYPGDEFIWVLEGEFTMLDGGGGVVAEVKQGQSAHIRNAAPVSWKQDGYLKKFYITYLDPTAEPRDIGSATGSVRVLDANAHLQPLHDSAPFDIDGPASRQAERTVYTNDAGNFSVGTWTSGPMVSKMRPFPAHEFVQMLEGEVTITQADGTAQTFVAGDCFFVPRGTMCSWSIREHVKKHYAVLDAG